MSTHLVIGSEGQLGTELVRQLGERGEEVTGVTRSDCDITSPSAVDRVFEAYEPEVVFNTAGYNDIDQAESVRDVAMGVNAMAPARVAAHCRRIGARFVHFSTAYVFGNDHDVAIDEGMLPEPLSVYGRSKLLGEKLALRNNFQTFVLRSSATYSARTDNFVRTMVMLALKGKPVTAIEDEIVSPTWVKPLADVAIELSSHDEFGVYHAACHGGCSWYELAQKVFDCLDLDGEVTGTTQERWGAAARRPLYSVLDNCMLRLAGMDRFQNWEETLETFLDEHGEEIVWDLS